MYSIIVSRLINRIFLASSHISQQLMNQTGTKYVSLCVCVCCLVCFGFFVRGGIFFGSKSWFEMKRKNTQTDLYYMYLIYLAVLWFAD